MDTNLSVSTAHLGGATVRTIPTFIVMLHHKTTLSYLILFIIEIYKTYIQGIHTGYTYIKRIHLKC